MLNWRGETGQEVEPLLSLNQREAEDLDHGINGRAPTKLPTMGRATEITEGSRSLTSSGTTALELEKSSRVEAAPRTSGVEREATGPMTEPPDRLASVGDPTEGAGFKSFDATSVSTRPATSSRGPKSPAKTPVAEAVIKKPLTNVATIHRVC